MNWNSFTNWISLLLVSITVDLCVDGTMKNECNALCINGKSTAVWPCSSSVVLDTRWELQPTLVVFFFFHNHRVKELEIIKKRILTHIFDSLALCLIRLMRKSLVTTVIIGIFPWVLNKLFSTCINNNEYSFVYNRRQFLEKIMWNHLKYFKQIETVFFSSVWPNER